MKHTNHDQLQIHSHVSMGENIIGVILFMLGIHLFLKNTPHAYEYSLLFVSCIILMIGAWFIVDLFLYKSLSSAIPGILFPIISVFLLIDFFASLPLSYSQILFMSALIGGAIAYGILYTEVQNKTYQAIAWILGILFGLQLISSFPFLKDHLVLLWPAFLIIAGASILWKVFRKSKT
ncbi:MAG TPA: hypothetical protein PLE09_00930 [Caldisericia bacterium]|nr:hypothetical protein [Caldisericia bacterium]HXK51103.1 hypothetical protein [Caldisericia bacterium]